MPPRVQSLDHLVLTVADLVKTSAFYRDILGMQTKQFVSASDGSTRWALKFGSQKINLHHASKPFDPKAKYPTPGSADLCFLSGSNLDEWTSHLAKHSVSIEEGPVARTGAQGPIMSIYIRDPDENLIEIANLISWSGAIGMRMITALAQIFNKSRLDQRSSFAFRFVILHPTWYRIFIERNSLVSVCCAIITNPNCSFCMDFLTTWRTSALYPKDRWVSSQA